MEVSLRAACVRAKAKVLFLKPLRSPALSAIAFDLRAVCDGLRAFAEAEVMPRHERHRELFEDPRWLYDADGRHCAEAGYYGMCVPESLGGGGLGLLAYYVGWQELFHLCGPRNWLVHWVISHWAFGPSRVLARATPEAREAFVDPMMRGKRSMCFGLSEPGAGSDAAMIKTKATPDGDGWRLNGRKIWTTNAPLADFCLLFAVTDPEAAAARRGGISAFLVPTHAPGFEIQRVVRFFGHIGGDEAELRFEDLHIEPWQLLGELHKGFATAVQGVSLGRIYNSAKAVGIGRWALEQAIDYAGLRDSFDAKIADHQGVSFPLAERATELHAAHLMGLNAAKLLDDGQAAVKEVAMTKLYSVERGAAACDTAMQTHGAMGFTNEMGLTEAWQICRVINVADGTNEIMKRTIAQRLMKGDTEL